ncbi:hypothetical protein M899_1836 [Bacteriovorax sp. BSW11_IV]|uniref:GrpB family protein n=1 Tax=Bacteriovorax sp. BSW11_IV TaxID=1353529 RepID=UPI000389E988|nr:GrpB family protein [Bacteriovorax sp. BSW11_IV]EQC48484.1 hypothetical protein M899_1836 [Bacteriovorax sp. BSW11_IV]
MANKKIELVPYDEFWKKVFAKESENLAKLLKANFIEAFHIGASAIEKIQSRPTLDILVVVHTMDGILAFKDEFLRAGFFLDDQSSSLEHFVFNRYGKDDKSVTLTRVHIFEKTNNELHNYIDFTEYLSAEDEVAQEYQKLREGLLDNELKYQQAKDFFIETTLKNLNK